MFAGLDMVRVVGELPAETDPLPVLKDINRPADLAWHGPAAQNPPPKPGEKPSALRRAPNSTSLPDGSVEMKSNGVKAGRQPMVRLAERGPV